MHFFNQSTRIKTETEVYLHSEESIKIYGNDGETIIGYRYPIFVDRELNVSTTLILITFKEPEKFKNIDLTMVKSEMVVVNP